MRTTKAQLYKGLIIHMFHYVNFVYMLSVFYNQCVSSK